MAQQIKITQTSNADMNIGVPKNLTAVEWLLKNIHVVPKFELSVQDIIKQAKQMEKTQIIDAIMYALDEDGHTGDWKIKFANDYYNKLNEGYDFSNKTRPRNFGEEAV